MADKVVEAKTSGATPADLLKQAVTGARPAPALRQTAARLRKWAIPGAALSLGVVGGAVAMLAMPRQEGAGETLSRIQIGIEAARLEAARLGGEIERVGRSVSALRESGEAARADAKSRSTSLTERVAKAEVTISAKVAALGERQEQIDRDHAARVTALAAQVEKTLKITAPAMAQPAQQTAKGASAEPAQTGAIADPRQKPNTLESWAVREVYDGVAMIEDRQRRLVEIAPGDTVPGVGRVEAIERRGKSWVVVTKQGVITSQTW